MSRDLVGHFEWRHLIIEVSESCITIEKIVNFVVVSASVDNQSRVQYLNGLYLKALACEKDHMAAIWMINVIQFRNV